MRGLKNNVYLIGEISVLYFVRSKIQFTVLSLTLILFSSFVVYADERDQGSILPEVVIAAPIPDFGVPAGMLPGTLTIPSNFEAKKKIQRTPGGVYVVGSEVFKEKYSLNFQDTVSHVPGVYATKRFAEEVRISIRGSGLERSFHQKGLTGHQDGVPFGSADGAGDFQEVDTLALQRI